MDSFAIGLVLGIIASHGALFVFAKSYDEAMQEAYERGHAVKCLGQTGYHWECEK